MKIAIFPNLSKENALEITNKAGEILKSHGAQVFISEDNIIEKDLFTPVPSDRLLKECDAAVVVGGDGTMIHVAKQAAKNGKPTLGINAGRIGYLAGLEANELENLKKLITGEYTVSQRMLLKATVDDKTFYCLNDAVIHRGELSRMVDISVDIDSAVMKARADGIIVATPTGSTAYSMSAGGPVVDSAVDGIILSYICPQSPGTRSAVVSSNSVLNVTASGAKDVAVYLTVDGEEAYKLSENSCVKICRDAEHTVKLIDIKNEPFWQVLSRKIK